jgi:hypothetical protein
MDCWMSLLGSTERRQSSKIRASIHLHGLSGFFSFSQGRDILNKFYSHFLISARIEGADMSSIAPSLSSTVGGRLPAISQGNAETIRMLQRRLLTGLLGWLRYEFSCGRGYLFEEKSLVLPIASIVAGRLYCTMFNEVAHPTLKAARNCPKLDFVACNRDTALLGIETKFSGWDVLNEHDVLHDLKKLVAFNAYTSAPGLFVFIGLSSLVERSRKSWSTRLTRMKGKSHGLVKLDDSNTAMLSGVMHYKDDNDVGLTALAWRVSAPKIKTRK